MTTRTCSLLCLLPLVGALLLSGCVSSSYQSARPDTRPLVALHLTAALPSVAAVVHHVITQQGPGSWKRDAYWDEYVVTIANRGPVPLTVERATLVDFQGASTQPAEDPWKLEAQSKTWWEKTKSSQTGNLVAIGAGAVGVSAALAGAALSVGSGFLGPTFGTQLALAGASAATLVAAPIYAVTVISINSHNKRKITAEFQRRRCVLPASLAPGQSAHGSLFFRISPGPRALTLRCRADGEPFDVALDLSALSHLHLAPPPSPPPAPPS